MKFFAYRLLCTSLGLEGVETLAALHDLVDIVVHDTDDLVHFFLHLLCLVWLLAARHFSLEEKSGGFVDFDWPGAALTTDHLTSFIASTAST